MAWVEFHIKTRAEFADTLGDALTALGAEALTTRDDGNQPIYEPAFDATPTWPETELVALFTADQNFKGVTDYLEKQRSSGHISHIEQVDVADQDWERTCLDQLEPMQFGERLWICPSWKTPLDANAVNIVLDPGLAFGTGTHPTTALCLTWLDKHIQGGEQVIDYGCGSGILALAALKLGADHVLAIDHDQRALDVTRENAERNDIPEIKLSIALPGITIPAQQADLVIANILAQPLMELAPLFANYLKPGGKIILSGILETQTSIIVERYQSWFEMKKPTQQHEWVCLEGTKRK